MSQKLNPTWDLDVFFPGGSSSDTHRKEIEALKGLLEELNEAIVRGDSGELPAIVNGIQQFEQRLISAYAFIGCLTAQDVTDEKAKLLNGQMLQLIATTQSALTRFNALLSSIADDEWQRLLQNDELQAVSFYLEERRQQAKEMLPPEQEVLVNDLSVDGYHAWEELYDTVVGRMKIPFTEKGETADLSVGQAHNKLYSEDRAVREEMMGKWEQAWQGEADLCATALNHLAGYRINLYRQRGWDDILKEPLAENRMQRETLEAMWDAVSRNKDIFKRYLQRKAKVLGVDALAWHDVDAPLGNVTKTMTYDEAAQFIVEHFRSFSPDMADFAQHAFENRWIEAEDRPGKRPGGFCTSFAAHNESRIFMTFEGSLDNVATLAHELGHAYHSHVMNDLPMFARDYAMNVAETASTFAEMIVADASLTQAETKDERLALLDDKAKRAIAFFMNIHARFLFETRFYDVRKQGPVSVEALNELMVEAQKEAFADSLGSYHPHFWASKLHFYITGQPFYNFPYTFGFLFSSGVYARAQAEGKGFAQKYVHLLRDTGSMTVENLAQRHLGVDLTKPDFWQQAVDLSVRDAEQFLQLTE
ncbi:M3 family oligoendopeptidase [Numidum massiliense]|uniref:M3 family oligoendopeptidase n=1 Tax=Numidum massiliense TaxID=1522315 RepID=UPI0006D58F2C|nr:M3 family oligoendopeptidase [Numidum massiliense]